MSEIKFIYSKGELLKNKVLISFDGNEVIVNNDERVIIEIVDSVCDIKGFPQGNFRAYIRNTNGIYNNRSIKINNNPNWILLSEVLNIIPENNLKNETYLDDIPFGKIRKCRDNKNGKILNYEMDIFHPYNGYDSKLISAPDIDSLLHEVKAQINEWDILYYEKPCLKNAETKTIDAINTIENIENLLINSLKYNKTNYWDLLFKNERYSNRRPVKPPTNILYKYPILKENDSFVEWDKKVEEIDRYNDWLEEDYKNELNHWNNKISIWSHRESLFLNEQKQFNLSIENLKKSYLQSDHSSIIKYCTMILNNSIYPKSFPKSFKLEYNPGTKIMIVEYQLPPFECFPVTKEVKYIASKNELKEIYISESQRLKMFDDTIYIITLRVINELFESDEANALNAISFNGWIEAKNKATGRDENNCILSIIVKKEEFVEIDLLNAEPKTCFKYLKGVASSKLSSIIPIQPIMTISKEDKRFVNSYNVSNQIDNSTNIAAMDWEDFEHLIRELFEKEFQSNGGEVKVTQASRDGGVDAIAFDPDPIRGGKIVIQAKRYTNTVGVSAVRDLYGTVINEGATKGILVSTADYGPDAHEFAKGKPITLLSGSHLLYLLEKHGHHAKIDIKEAKIILAEREKK